MHLQVSDCSSEVRTNRAGNFTSFNEQQRFEENMQDENLGESLTESYRTHKRTVAVRNLGERTHLTLEQIAKLVSHAEHGDIVKDITLQELLDVTAAPEPDEEPEEEEEEEEEEETAAPSSKRRGSKKKAKKAKKAAKKKAKKAAKKAAKKTTSRGSGGRKADYGKKKPRLDYDQGCKEILAALKAHGEPAARGELEDATGYSGVQVRTFCKRLAENGKIQILGKGGRSTRYGLP